MDLRAKISIISAIALMLMLTVLAGAMVTAEGDENGLKYENKGSDGVLAESSELTIDLNEAWFGAADNDSFAPSWSYVAATNTITVTDDVGIFGTVFNAGTLMLDIADGIMVTWNAAYSLANGDGIILTNSGTLNITGFGSIDCGLTGSAVTATVPASVINYGTVSGGNGINLMTGGTVVHSAVVNDAVVNYGRIVGNTYAGVKGGDAFFSVRNYGGAYIEGKEYGVFIGNGGGGVANSGTINGVEDTGVHAVASAYINSDGIIEGGINGVSLYSSGTVDNHGRIVGNTAAGVRGGNVLISVFNFAGAYIEGKEYGVFIGNGGATVDNRGTIKGSDGIYSLGQADIANANTGVIEGAINGIVLVYFGTVGNYGRIVGDTFAGVVGGDAFFSLFNSGGAYIGGTENGVRTGNGGAFVDNWGTIKGAEGIYAYGSVDITNGNIGVIEGEVNGINLAYYGTVGNYGRIVGNMFAGVVGGDAFFSLFNSGGAYIGGTENGVRTGNGGAFVDNWGTIKGAEGIYAYGSVDITNGNIGVIEGEVNGINLAYYGTVGNYGRIVGNMFAGIVSGDAFLTLNNAGGAYIEGKENGVRIGNGGAVIENWGTIRGIDGIYGVGQADITNGNIGVIEGAINGINLAYYGMVKNNGRIVGNTFAGVIGGDAFFSVYNHKGAYIEGKEYGVFIGNGAGGVANSGTINGVEDAGVHGVANVYINSDGIIEGGINGVSLYSSGVVDNYGRIVGNTFAGIVGGNAFINVFNFAGAYIEGKENGVRIGSGGGIVDNSGTIKGIDGIYSVSSADVINYGIIEGVNNGVSLNGNAKMTVSGGAVVATGANGTGISSGGIVIVTGGVVQAGEGGYAIRVWGVAAYLQGTCTGDLYAPVGSIVEVDTIEVPVSRDGTSIGLTVKDGQESAAWNCTGAKPAIDFTAGTYSTSVEWAKYVKLGITTAPLAGGTVGTEYSQALTSTDTATWSLFDGILPNGLTLSPDGVISGKPTASGSFTFTVKAENAGGYDIMEFTITIKSSGSTGVVLPAVIVVSVVMVILLLVARRFF
ncbi:MAG: Ig domain-containing protein [Methanomassiliicoccaceae archaeon]|jgi:hypothetical protein|nr:Ig domain-containing protein [Methanomassiliicoccaceae archaeon]